MRVLFVLVAVAAIHVAVGSNVLRSLTSAPGSACAGAQGKCGVWTSNTCKKPKKIAGGMCPGAANVKCCLTPCNTIPTWDKLSKAYPQGDGESVRKMIGGGIDNPKLINTCAIRISHAFNAGGCALRGGYVMSHSKRMRKAGKAGKRAYNLKSAKKQVYFPRVVEFGDYLRVEFGPPTITLTPTPPAKRGIDDSQIKKLKGKQGVIRFDTAGAWGDATGHYDLWDGTMTSKFPFGSMWEINHRDVNRKYFDLSVAVEFWPAGFGRASASSSSSSSSSSSAIVTPAACKNRQGTCLMPSAGCAAPKKWITGLCPGRLPKCCGV